MTTTQEQTNNLFWIRGFRARIEGKPRPAGGHDRQGWDAADKLLKTAAPGEGGY